MAAQGYKQFWFSMAMVRSSTSFKDEAGVQAITDLKDSELTEVKDHITSNLGKQVAKKQVAPKEPESQEKKRGREATSARNVALRKCKQLVDSAMNTTTRLQTDLPNLVTKGYPEPMVQWCEDKIKSIREKIASTQSIYNKEVVKVTNDGTTTEALEKDTKMLDEAQGELDTAWTEWKKTSLVEVRKLLS